MIVDQYGQPIALPKARRPKNSLENPATSLADPDAWLLDAMGGGETESGVHVNRKTAIGYPPLWRGINLISGDVAKLPLNLFERSGEAGKEKAVDHPAHKLMRRKPNPWMTANVFKRTMQYHALLFGNGYAAIFRSLKTPVELVILSPTDTFPVQAQGRLWYVTKAANEQRRIPAEDVLHIRGLSFDGLIGHSVLEVMAEALGLGMAAREFGSRFFGSGSNMSGVLMVPGKFKQEQIANAIASWEEMARGLKRAHKIALLQDGVKWQPTTISPEQGQFNETRQFEIREVANILGIPPHKLGDSSRTSYNSLEQENKSYLQDGLDHWLCAWEDECFDKLLTEKEKANDSHFFEYLREAYIQTDGETKIKMLVEQVNNGLLLPDEARAIQNLPPYPNGVGQKFRMPSNVMVVRDDGELAATDGQANGETDMTTKPAGTNEDAAATGDIQATALNGAQIASLVTIGDKVATDEWPGEAAKPALRAAFPLMDNALIESMVNELEKHEPPPPPPQETPFGGPPAGEPEQPPGEPPAEGEPNDALAAAHRKIIASDLQRMVRRLSGEAKTLAKNREKLGEWLATFESEHKPRVSEVVHNGIFAHCVATSRTSDAEPLTVWACGLLFDAYRQDMGVTLAIDGDITPRVEAMADRFERELAVQIAEQITQGAMV